MQTRPRLAMLLLAGFCVCTAASAQEKEPVEVDWKLDRRKEKYRGGSGSGKLLGAALTWLVNHQSPDGRWDSDGFSAECGRLGDDVCASPGLPIHDVGVTGLALLALAGADAHAERGGFGEPMARAVGWLLEQQDAETGVIGDRRSHDFLYDHIIATYALVDSLYRIEDEDERKQVQRAVDFILEARNPYGAWRYTVPPTGENDTSITAWALNVLVVARNREGLEVPEDALRGGMEWIRAVTDLETARVGYDSEGSLSARTMANQRFPREFGEAMTAAGLWCRYLVGEDYRDEKLMTQQAKLLLAHRPEWSEDGFTTDMYYWYYATYAMFQRSSREWNAWNGALKKTLKASQVEDGDARGSWDPIGPWGYAGGRVYSTALMALTLEVYYRYPRFED